MEERILEPENLALLSKLIKQAETIKEAIEIAKLGTSYKRTGFHFDKKIEKLGNNIKYFKKNEELSFTQKDAKNTHKLIIGDNFDALQNLLISYKNKIDVIYIDPPYGKDDMGEFADTNYTNAITRDNLLSMLYSRLILAKQLLSDDGIIYCSIDDKNQAYVKCLMDEIFDEKNFLFNIYDRKTKTSTGDQNNGLNTQHDYILAYMGGGDITIGSKEKNYAAYSNPDGDPKGDWTSGDPSAKSGSSSTYFEIRNPYTNQVDYPPKGRYWAFSKQSLNEYIQSGKITFRSDIKKGVRGFVFKRYKCELKSTYNSFDSLCFTTNSFLNSDGTSEVAGILGSNVFSYPKPVALIKYLIDSVKKDNICVLDFFAGSGTTGQAVMELNKEDSGNRTFILCTNNEKTESSPRGIAYDVTSKRLKRVMTGSCYDGSVNFEWLNNNSPLGDDLDVYEIAEVSNSEQNSGKTPFDVIDETLYGQPSLLPDKKIEWVCKNFEHTQKYLVDAETK